MIKNFLFRKTVIPNLSKGLDVYALRQKAISGNIANVQTPGYRRKEVRFEDKLQSALKKQITGVRTHSNHLPVGRGRLEDVSPRVVEDESKNFASGVNNVDIEREMVDQVKNEIRFVLGSRLINKNFAFLRASIKGRFDQ